MRRIDLCRWVVLSTIGLLATGGLCRAGWVASGQVPPALREHLETLDLNKVDVQCLSWDGLESWVVISGGQIKAGGPEPENMVAYVRGMIENGNTPRSIFFNTASSWTVIGRNGVARAEGSSPDGLTENVKAAIDAGAFIQSVAYTPNGAWVCVTNKAVNWGGPVPDDMMGTLTNLSKQGRTIRTASLATNGSWIVDYD